MPLYADFDYYSNTYYDALQEIPIPNTQRTVYLRKASSYLDSIFVHSKPQEPYPEAVKNACCEIADCFYTCEQKEGIASENNDGYSVSYNANNFEAKMTLHKAYAIALRYLGSTGLLYRGIGVVG